MENKKQHFKIIPALLKEMEEEATSTRKMLALVPDDKHEWRPHERSMKMGPLATHLAELPSWVSMALHTEGLDFAGAPYEPTVATDNAALVALLDKSYQSGREALAAATEEALLGRWVLRTGDKIHGDYTKYETIRHAFAQTSHHRAQLGVYLRLLQIPIPGVYGPSADDMNF
jgi:uncharacterized damage-inducible protein DinB